MSQAAEYKSKALEMSNFYRYSPEIGEPFDELRRVVLVELDVWEVGLEHRGGRVAGVEEHQLGLPKVHRRQRRRVGWGETRQG